jgi:Ca2+-dependent lipid-binding protein
VIEKTLNPVWNESFTFEIGTGQEPLTIIVMDQDLGNDDFEGQVVIPLDTLGD